MVNRGVKSAPRFSLSQKVLDSVRAFLVVRAESEGEFGAADEWLKRIEAERLGVPVYHHVPSKWAWPGSRWVVTLYCCNRTLIVEESAKEEVGLRQMEEFYRLKISPESEGLKAKLEEEGAMVLYVRADCVHCCHIKPLLRTLKDTSIYVFDVSKNDYPENSPVVRVVPTLLDKKKRLVVVENIASFMKAVGHVCPNEMVTLYANDANCQRYANGGLQNCFQSYTSAAVGYYYDLLAAPPDLKILVNLNIRADDELCLEAEKEGPMDIYEYLTFMRRLTREFSAETSIPIPDDI